MIKRAILASLLLLAAAQAVTACGRIGPPAPPAGEPNIYPKAYPSADKN